MDVAHLMEQNEVQPGGESEDRNIKLESSISKCDTATEQTECLDSTNSSNFDFKQTFGILHPVVVELFERLTDEFFRTCFHFEKLLVGFLLLELHQRTYGLALSSQVVSKVPFDVAVLVTLSYLVHGHFHYIKQLNGLQQYSECDLQHCIINICEIIVYFLTPAYITFPYEVHEVESNKLSFLKRFGLPGVVGVLDCFQAELSEVPYKHRQLYSNRYGQLSLNVQVICDQNYRFLDVNPRFFGRTSDLYIWKRSHIRQIITSLQKRDPYTWLVANRNHRFSPLVMSPYRNATSPQQNEVNVALGEVHKIVGKSVALLRARFRCLNGELQFNHRTAANIITTCTTLHNYLIANNVDIIGDLFLNVPKRIILPNAEREDTTCSGHDNREFIKHYIFNNSFQIPYILRLNSNLNFEPN